jgi:hypothetical protein
MLNAVLALQVRGGKRDEFLRRNDLGTFPKGREMPAIPGDQVVGSRRVARLTSGGFVLRSRCPMTSIRAFMSVNSLRRSSRSQSIHLDLNSGWSYSSFSQNLC